MKEIFSLSLGRINYLFKFKLLRRVKMLLMYSCIIFLFNKSSLFTYKNNSLYVHDIVFTFLIMTTFMGNLALGSEVKYSEIKGRVFYDLNQNSIMDFGENGVGGVRVYTDFGETTSSDEKGYYSLKVKELHLQVRVELDRLTIPGGGRVTGQGSYGLAKSPGIVRVVNFPIYYPKLKKNIIEDLSNSNNRRINLSKEYNVSIKKIENDKFLINGVEKSFYVRSLERRFDIDKTTSLPDMNKLKSTLSSDFKNVYDISIYLPSSISSKKTKRRLRKIIKNTVDSRVKDLKRTNFYEHSNDFLLISSNAGGEDCSAFFNGQLVNESNLILSRFKSHKIYFTCRFSKQSIVFKKIEFNKRIDSNTFKQMGIKSVTDLEVLSADKLQIDKTEFKITSNDLPVKISYEIKDTLNRKKKDNTEEIIVEYPEYLYKSRFNRTFLNFKFTNVSKVKVGDKYYNDSYVNYIHEGARGENNINIKFEDSQGQERTVDYKFKLFDIENFNLSYFRLKSDTVSRSELFDVRYKIEDTYSHYLKHKNFFGDSYGISLDFDRDTTDIKIDRVNNDTALALRTNIRFEGVYRWSINANDFFSNEIRVFAGIRYKGFDISDEDVVFFVPEDFKGLSLSTELYVKKWPLEDIDNTFTVHYAISPENTKLYEFSYEQEIKFGLNKLGALFGIEPYFNYQERYQYLENFYIALIYRYEKSSLNAINFNQTLVSTDNSSLGIGIVYQY